MKGMYNFEQLFYAPNNSLKIHGAKSYSTAKEIKSTIIAEDVNTPLSITDKSHRQKISENMKDLNNTTNQPTWLN